MKKISNPSDFKIVNNQGTTRFTFSIEVDNKQEMQKYFNRNLIEQCFTRALTNYKSNINIYPDYHYFLGFGHSCNKGSKAAIWLKFMENN